MAADVEFNDASLEAARLRLRTVCAQITLNSNTNVALITGYTDVTNVKIYYETNVQPTPVDTGATFGTLDSNAAPSTVGLLILTGNTVATGNAYRIVDVRVPVPTISTTAGMTAAVPSLAGLSTTGVTVSGNIAVVLSCTGLDLDSISGTNTFWVYVDYLCSPQNAS